MQQTLYIVRGLPGSGKSTFANTNFAIRGAKHFEADMYFCRFGEYEFDSLLIRNAHRWCYESTKTALQKGHDVVVSNTFTRKWEMQEYLDLRNSIEGLQIQIFAMTDNYGNVHGVPPETIAKMQRRWEPIHGENIVISADRHTTLVSDYKGE